MPTTVINLNGIHQLDFPSGVSSASTAAGVTTINLASGGGSGVIGITIDGGGSVPSTGLKGFVQLPYPATITGWSLLADQAGSASIDVWFIAGSAPPSAPSIPTSANKISASAPPALTSAQAAAGGASAVSTWTTALSQWGTVAFNLTAASGVNRIALELQVAK